MPSLPALTSLRFFAALLVFFSHLNFLNDSSDPGVRDFFIDVMYQGYVGVTFFFVLSGFILAYAHQNRPINKANYSDFLFSRIARIYPLHLLTLAIVIVPFWHLAPAGMTVSEYLRPLPWNLTLTQALSSSPKKFFSFNAPSWSLSVELFFYVLFPLFVVLKTRTLLVVALTLAVFKSGLAHVLPESKLHYAMYISAPLRLADFLVGILLLRLFTRFNAVPDSVATRLQWASLAVLAAVAATWSMIPQAYRYDLYAVLPMAGIVLSFAYQNGTLAKAISRRPLIVLGEASFAFYMVHQTWIRCGEALRGNMGISHSVGSDVAVAVVYFLLSLTTSLVLWRYFETPAKRLTLHCLQAARQRLRQRRTASQTPG